MLDAPGERACRALVAVFEMAAVLPCERRRLARVCEEFLLLLNAGADARHRGVLRARLAVAEAEVDGLRVHCVLPRVIHPIGKPDGRRCGGTSGERIRLIASVEREQRCKRIAADEEAHVIWMYELSPHDWQDFIVKARERLRCPAAERILAERRRRRPRAEVVVPVVNADGGEEDVFVGTGFADELKLAW